MTKAAIVALAGPDLAPEEAALLADARPLGIILFGRNIVDARQLSRLIGDVRQALPPDGLLMIDQEGGRVARMRPPAWRAHPPAAAIGLRAEADLAAGVRLARATGALIGLDCAEAGFDVVCAPVLDVAGEGMTAAIGDRSFGADPARVAALARAAADGLMSAGVQPVAKHAPGHGRARVDSHVALPRLGAEEDLEPEIAAFAACADLPWMMTAHVVYDALDPERPATLSPPVIERVIRGRIGFGGVLVSDDLSMGALSGSAAERAGAAVAAGCDVALHCSGRLDESRAALDAVPCLSRAARDRLARARALVDGRRAALDRHALVADQSTLLA